LRDAQRLPFQIFQIQFTHNKIFLITPLFKVRLRSWPD